MMMVEEIAEVVKSCLGIRSPLNGQSRRSNVVFARKVAMYFAAKLGRTHEEIARYFKRDRSQVTRAVAAIGPNYQLDYIEQELIRHGLSKRSPHNRIKRHAFYQGKIAQ